MNKQECPRLAKALARGAWQGGTPHAHEALSIVNITDQSTL